MTFVTLNGQPFLAPPICNCGGNVVYATVCVSAPHAINCPVGIAQVDAWLKRTEAYRAERDAAAKSRERSPGTDATTGTQEPPR